MIKFNDSGIVFFQYIWIVSSLSFSAGSIAESTDVSHDKSLTPFPSEITVLTPTWKLSSEEWEIKRNGESVMAISSLNNLITRWLSNEQKVAIKKRTNVQTLESAIIEIQYPGGEEGEIWVQELSDWLVSLGIPSHSMLLLPGSAVDDEITFRLISP